MVPLLAPADVIVSNILRLINTALLPEVHAALRPGGIAIFSGMESAEADLFRPPLLEAGFRFVAELVDESWWAVPRPGHDRPSRSAGEPGCGRNCDPRSGGGTSSGGPARCGRDGNPTPRWGGEPRARRVVEAGKRIAVLVEEVTLDPAPVETVLAVAAGDRDRFGILVEQAGQLGATRWCRWRPSAPPAWRPAFGRGILIGCDGARARSSSSLEQRGPLRWTCPSQSPGFWPGPIVEVAGLRDIGGRPPSAAVG